VTKKYGSKNISLTGIVNEGYVKEVSSTICKETQQVQQESPGIFST